MSLILRCPVCEKHYEANDDVIKQTVLHCPLCDADAAASDFSAMMFCPHCRGKLAVSLDMLSEATLSCPRCDRTFVPTVNISLDDDDDDEMELFTDDEEAKSTFNEGDFFDKYKIIRLLGKGGMGEVYLAEHLFLHREVALKIMLSDMSKNSVFAKRFIREAKIANKIESPNLIGVYDVGVESKSEMLFIAMEYIKGKNVSELLKEHGVFDEKTTLSIAYSVLNVLEIMERENIVHRDIKPSNIMIDYAGNIKLADLGIAKSNNHADGDLTLTQESVVFGTPNYASPEQCRSSHNVDSRSDIYSLGATMFHMVAGEAPYTGDTGMEIMLKVLGDATPDFCKLNSCSSNFIALLISMLQKDPVKRPQSIIELKLKVERLLKNNKNSSPASHKKIKKNKKKLPQNKKKSTKILEFLLWLILPNTSGGTFKYFIFITIFCIIFFAIGFFLYVGRDSIVDAWIKHAEGANAAEISEKREKIIAEIKKKHQYRSAKKKEELSHYSAKKADITPKKSVQKTAAPVPVPAAADVSVRKTAPEAVPEVAPVVKNVPVTVPEPQKKTVVPKPIADAAKEKTVKVPPAKKITAPIVRERKIYPDTMQGRLMRCRDVIAELKDKIKKNPNDKIAKESLEFMQNTVLVNISRQLNNMRKAAEKKQAGKFDEDANRKIKSFYSSFAAPTRDWRGYHTSYRDFIRAVSIGNFDPNITVADPHQPDRIETLLRSVLRNKFISRKLKETVISNLLRQQICDTSLKGLDGNLYDERIVSYGIEELNDYLEYSIKENHKNIPMLIELGVDVNTKINGASLLHWAVSRCNYETVYKLLLAGADVHSVDSEGQTPLFPAVKYADESVVKLLVLFGSDIEYSDKKGKKADDYKHYNVFNKALKNNNYKKIESIIAQYPELVDSVIYDGDTPLCYAVVQNNALLVSKLIALKANVNQLSPLKRKSPAHILADNLTQDSPRPLSYAQRNKMLSIYKVLLKAGAEPHITKNTFKVLNAKKNDSINFNFMIETARHIKKEKDAIAALDHIYRRSYHDYNGNFVDDSRDRAAIVSTVFRSVKIDMSQKKCHKIFVNAASNPQVSENELKLMLHNKADIDSKDNEDMTALFKLCQISCNYTQVSFRRSAKIPPLNNLTQRIIFLLVNKAQVDIGCRGQTIADLNLPQDVKNIYKIRRFLQSKRVY